MAAGWTDDDFVSSVREIDSAIAVVDGSGFNSPTDFIVYVLRDLMGEAEEHANEFNQDELDEVKRKLKNLGYL